ncbi:hypothetical protein BSKO_06704 [Bryopsis sp. KO-2023]|nr:hypothetical protein BSKO_06704 [Bryopsis sp. KO-2023]
MGKKKARGKKDLDELFDADPIAQGEKAPSTDDPLVGSRKSKKKGKKGGRLDGDVSEESDPENGEAPEIQPTKTSKKKKGKKGKNASIDFDDGGEEEIDVRNEGEGSEQMGKKKKQKGKSGFDALMDDEGDDKDDLSEGGKDEEEEEEEEDFSMAKPKGKKKKDKKKAVVNAFSALGDESDEDATVEKSQASDEEEEEGPPLVQPKGKKKKGKRGGKMDSAFDALAMEEEEEEEEKPLSDEEPPMPSVQPKGKKKKKGKSKGLDSAFDALAIEDEDEGEKPLSDEEPSMPSVQPKGKKKKKGKSTGLDSAFAALDEDDVDMEEEVSVAKPKKKKGKKAAASSAFDALAIEDDGEDEEEDEEKPMSDEEPSLPSVQPKGKKKKKGKSKGLESAFDALAMEDEEEEEKPLSDVEPIVPPLQLKSKKKKKKSKGLESAFDALAMEEEEEKPLSDEEPPMPSVQPKGKKKKKGKSKGLDSAFDALAIEDEDVDVEIEAPVSTTSRQVRSGFAALAAEEEGEVEEEEEPVAVDVKPKKKKKKGKAVLDAFDALEEESELALPEAEAKPKKSKKKKKGAGSAFEDAFAALDEDEEGGREEPASSINVEEEMEVSGTSGNAGSEPVIAPAPVETKGSKKKKKKGKGASTAQPEEDIDAILAEIEGKAAPKSAEATPPPEKVEKPAESSTPAPSEPSTTSVEKTAEKSVEESAGPAAEPTPSGELQDDHEEGEDSGKPLTAAQKKKLRKKAKKAKDKEKHDEPKEEKLPAHVRKMREALEKQRLMEEQIKAQEEERQRLEEEARKAEEEALRRKEEEKLRKKKEREELRKAGVPMTKKAQEEARRREAMRLKLLSQAAEKGIALPETKGEKSEAPLESRASIKKAQRQKELQKAAEEKQRQEEERIRKQEEARKAKAAKLEEEKRLAEEKKRKEEEEEAADDWEDVADDWEVEEDKPEPEVEEEVESKEGVKSTVKSEEEEEDEESESESESESETESSSEEDSSSEYTTDSEDEREKKLEATRRKMEAKIQEAKESANADNLRSPICCILGHVDTGKTKILDNIRQTNVQDNEAGGITQQIGATYIPSEALLSRTEKLRDGREYNLKVPGLLVIDTPGHESFTNLRSRGSSLCDIAVLVVDLMHGLEQQTIESINLLKQRKTPFIVALNKVDRLFDWKEIKNNPIRLSLQQQKKHTKADFEARLELCTTQLMEQGMNVSLYWKNKDQRTVVNMVPTSAFSGEGIPDLLQLLVKLTTSRLSEKLMFLGNVLQCTVLEVKAIEGLGTTVDVVLVNGELHEGDKVVMCGMSGPIVTTIRSLLTPHPLKELRVKGSYLHHKTIQAAQGIKICAQGLEQAVAGTAMYVVGEDDDEEDYTILAKEEMESVMSRIDRSGEGVCVQASTLGSLEALLDFLKTPEVSIPVSAINIGPVHKRDVMRANVMIEKKIKKFGVILAFDIPVTREARELAEDMGVKIFTADIIYHLFDQFKNYMIEVKKSEKSAARDEAIFPAIVKIIPSCIFNAKDPIVLGVEILDGQLRIASPLCVPAKSGRPEVNLGRVESLELNHKAVEVAHKGDSVAVKIRATNAEEASRLYGRHFTADDDLVSRITRESINSLKMYFKDEMSKDDWRLVVRLKSVFQIN